MWKIKVCMEDLKTPRKVKHICNSHMLKQNPKIAKELALPTQGRKNNETLTMHIKNCRDSRFTKVCSTYQGQCILIRNRFEVGNFSYADRCRQASRTIVQ
jgi:hypothetical protein